MRRANKVEWHMQNWYFVTTHWYGTVLESVNCSITSAARCLYFEAVRFIVASFSSSKLLPKSQPLLTIMRVQMLHNCLQHFLHQGSFCNIGWLLEGWSGTRTQIRHIFHEVVIVEHAGIWSLAGFAHRNFEKNKTMNWTFHAAMTTLGHVIPRLRRAKVC